MTAIDRAGNTGPSATVAWTIDMPRAAVTLTASPSTLTYGQAATLTAQVKVGAQPRADVAVRFCRPAGPCTTVGTDRAGTARLTVKFDHTPPTPPR